MPTIFDPSSQDISKEQDVARRIDGFLRNAATAMYQAYAEIRRLIYENQAFATFENVNGTPVPTYTPDAVYAAFQQYTISGLSATQLGQAARLLKTFINHFYPGKITDDVPEVVITWQ